MDFLKGAMERVKPEVKRLIRRELDKMTETNAKIHVLADETLGGIKREYVEVDREAIEGESIVIVGKKFPEDMYNNGDILTVDRDFHSEMTFVESDEAISAEYNCSGLIYHEEYHVLEPTDIVHIDGERYVLTDREAEVGEKVVYVNKDCGESDGVVTEVTSVGVSMVDVSVYEASDGDSVYGFSHGYYRVLVPVEAADDEPKPADPIDVIANLAQEVAELKRKVSDLETTVERHERVNDRHRDEIDTLYKDKRTIGEELARLAAEVGKETESSAKAMAEAFVALRRAGL
ncbi:ATG16 family protein [Bacillus velezensis]|uniref:ATG16 family protein n=1 Tax=Bacillus velezensis TaxID=492670 RepID=UPI001F0FA5BF|nr:ATG16 family protein [Bacillus velezensis]UMQ50243.1 ATG16 family protein [Bacillus velezensis]